ncbi:hypothetical protein N7465_005011 [Penicillium sp. CMV-2018d]|nr:hypothetical protein N7465_005011 [Penicillium sp. CMV-2018d]
MKLATESAKGNLYIKKWYKNITTPDFRIKPTPNSWIDDETAFKWLFSFYKATINLHTKAYLMVNEGRYAFILRDCFIEGIFEDVLST